VGVANRSTTSEVGNIKRFLTAVIEAKRRPRIVFLDEIEKAFAGTGTDLSGVKTELTGTSCLDAGSEC